VTPFSGGAARSLAPADITKDAMRRAFASYAATHEPASTRRCWSTWNVLCDFLFTADLIASNPMPLVGRPTAARTLTRPPAARLTDPTVIQIDETARAVALMKVVYLDTAVLLAAIEGQDVNEFPETRSTAAACRKFVLVETDADAVAVAMPARDWEAVLFTTAHMREAVETPGGTLAGPTPTIKGFRLVETICKHREGAVTA